MSSFKNWVVFSALLILVSVVHGGDGVWLKNYGKAMKVAKKTGKPILADFTGSDWCGYCKKLDRTVFSTEKFKKWANENVVLLEIDFPRYKRQTPGTARQNQRLANKFGVTGYPTILILDGKGKPLGRLGYREGGPEPWIAEAEKIIARARDTAP